MMKRWNKKVSAALLLIFSFTLLGAHCDLFSSARPLSSPRQDPGDIQLLLLMDAVPELTDAEYQALLGNFVPQPKGNHQVPTLNEIDL